MGYAQIVYMLHINCMYVSDKLYMFGINCIHSFLNCVS